MTGVILGSMKLTKLTVALSLIVLLALAASSTAWAGGQNLKVEAKVAVKAALKADRMTSRAVLKNDRLRTELRSIGRCTGKVLKDAPENTPDGQTGLLVKYSFIDAWSRSYAGTKRASRSAISILLAASESVKNKTLRRGLTKKAQMLIVSSAPTGDSCAVAKAWKANGYKGAFALIKKDIKQAEGISFKPLIKFYTKSNSIAERASRLISRTLSPKAGNNFASTPNPRTSFILLSTLLEVAVED